MLFSIKDKDDKQVAFSLEMLGMVVQDPMDSDRILLYINGVQESASLHFTVEEFMQNLHKAMEQLQGRASLLGMMHPQSPARKQ